ncbi:endo alpha-1,4 polygalactosaminidase [Nocardioides speluncae]|uniref:endo alpha-1,4 polygalactosaminidase n=1 Tax=Nocardioides speluncae TaxID=2670337 RepID=UPI000D68F66E|nr:endo alpha-1,4 polygalactosaminidase [Nocardioides speluncae]
MSARLLAVLLGLTMLGLPAPARAADPPQLREAHSEPGWWRPSAARPLTLHWVLGDRLDVHDPRSMGLRDHRGRKLPAPDVYDIDGELNPKSTVDLLHRRGKKAICYFDAGAYETYRRDAWKFRRIEPRIWGKPDLGWNDSYWLDIRRVDDLEPIMKARMRMCKRKGFDAVEPDQIDGWENSMHPRTHKPSAKHGLTGFPISRRHQLRYNRALARWAHELGLSIGQKGDLIQTRDLVSHFDWTLNEECFQFRECIRPYDPRLGKVFPGLQLYVRAGKAVFVAEYEKPRAKRWRTICRDSRKRHFNTARFELDLPRYGRRTPCMSARDW